MNHIMHPNQTHHHRHHNIYHFIKSTSSSHHELNRKLPIIITIVISSITIFINISTIAKQRRGNADSDNVMTTNEHCANPLRQNRLVS